jgi:uncharacterized radical SAM superfamily Fe-S cluster-containing enzyme
MPATRTYHETNLEKATLRSVLLEVTKRCNLGCPLCCAGARVLPIVPHVAMAPLADAPLEEIALRYDALCTSLDTQTGSRPEPLPTVILSGGEPTYRADLCDIVAFGCEKGFQSVWLATNGLRLAEFPPLAGRLRSAGLGGVLLQFDGTDDAVHRILRGRPLLALKQRALAACASVELPVVLVTTVVGGINDRTLVDIISFGAEHAPTVRGMRFQPFVRTGRFDLPEPARSRVRDIALAQLPVLLEQQSGGVLTADDLLLVEGPDEPTPYCFYDLAGTGKAASDPSATGKAASDSSATGKGASSS